MSVDRTWDEVLEELKESEGANLRFIEINQDESTALGAYLNARLITPIVGLTPPAEVSTGRDFTTHPLWPLLTRLTRVQLLSSPNSWTVALYSSEIETLGNDLSGQMNLGNTLLENAKLSFKSIKQKWEGSIEQMSERGSHE